jgi:L-ascorbate metabolism protein UlaG (beta-lactamase superfamily)
MIITHHGKQFFKVQTGDMVLAFNPISKDSKFKTNGFGADIALVSENHPDYNGADLVSYGNKNPFVINGPGEYEVSEIMIQGFLSKGTDGKSELVNTVYYLEFDDIKILFLGALYQPELSLEVRQAIGDVDLLFVPIGGKTVIGPEAAHKLAVSFGPKAIIPMDYGSDQEKDALKDFLKASGAEKVAPVDKLTIKAKDLAGKEQEVIVIEG